MEFCQHYETDRFRKIFDLDVPDEIQKSVYPLLSSSSSLVSQGLTPADPGLTLSPLHAVLSPPTILLGHKKVLCAAIQPVWPIRLLCPHMQMFF